MGLRSSSVVVSLAVWLLLLPSLGFAQAVPALDCGPQFNRLTAENVIPSYRQALATRESVRAFHHSIPFDYGPFELSFEAKVTHLRDCYRRVEGLLTPRAEAGEVEAQFVLGDLLLRAYSFLLGGYTTYGPLEGEIRKRGHNWLRTAEENGSYDAVETLAWFYSSALSASQRPSIAGKLYANFSWLPVQEDLLDWLQRAGARGHRSAYVVLSGYYVERFTFGLLEHPEQAQVYREQSNRYRRLSEQGVPRSHPGGEDRGHR